MDWAKYIDHVPGVLAGKAVFQGTRIGVDLVLERLGDGWGVDQILAAYPALSAEHIRAAQAYAAAALSTDERVALG